MRVMVPRYHSETGTVLTVWTKV